MNKLIYFIAYFFLLSFLILFSIALITNKLFLYIISGSCLLILIIFLLINILLKSKKNKDKLLKTLNKNKKTIKTTLINILKFSQEKIVINVIENNKIYYLEPTFNTQNKIILGEVSNITGDIETISNTITILTESIFYSKSLLSLINYIFNYKRSKKTKYSNIKIIELVFKNDTMFMSKNIYDEFTNSTNSNWTIKKLK